MHVKIFRKSTNPPNGYFNQKVKILIILVDIIFFFLTFPQKRLFRCPKWKFETIIDPNYSLKGRGNCLKDYIQPLETVFLPTSGKSGYILKFLKVNCQIWEDKHDMTLLPLQCHASHMSPLLPRRWHDLTGCIASPCHVRSSDPCFSTYSSSVKLCLAVFVYHTLLRNNTVIHNAPLFPSHVCSRSHTHRHGSLCISSPVIELTQTRVNQGVSSNEDPLDFNIWFWLNNEHFLS